ncbi:AbrB/MazE/SpoVT family DNA-binding domain-containing protein [Thiofilum flexile]|uniref:AbrB/MazE/SpoVT family DNA-binding domain-containing protein n=1 Tax=Thiofilum flexile TaxID=125627 RepID=UPI0003699FA9|nr:AbrB/MazE/SpoVT family DNA-binding domain-containing protein [Thiofilum flexile]
MTILTTNVSQGGRIVLPIEIRQKLGIQVGDQIILEWIEETSELRLMTRKLRLQRARKLVQSYIKPASSMVDELIAERREAAKYE